MRGLTLGQEYTLTLTIIDKDKEEEDKEETSFTFTACKSYRQFGRVSLYNSIVTCEFGTGSDDGVGQQIVVNKWKHIMKHLNMKICF